MQTLRRSANAVVCRTSRSTSDMVILPDFTTTISIDIIESKGSQKNIKE